MQIAVLGGAGQWLANDLRRAAAQRHRIVTAGYDQLATRMYDSGLSVRCGSVDLGACDAVLLRSMPRGSLEEVVFRMDALALLAEQHVALVNPPRAMETAIDKCLTTARLWAAGLPTPQTAVCQTVEEAVDAFDQLGRDVVLKPIFGGEGRGISRVTEVEVLARAARLLVDLGAVVYVQQFVPNHGFDVRVLLVGSQVFAVRRHNPDDWRSNISRGARAEPLVLDDEVLELARRAARAVGATLAGVDLLPARDGTWHVLEVNAVPGWRHTARVLNTDVTAAVLAHLVESASAAAETAGERHRS